MGQRLGQHFLIRRWVAVRLVESLHITAGETVLEIGPGKGALTIELLKTGARVVAVEKDEQLARALRQTFRKEIAEGRLVLVTADIRDFDPERQRLRDKSYRVAANIPYYITGDILRKLLSGQHQPRSIAMLVQKEVADRIVARDGKESILSISVKAYGSPKIIARVSRSNFSPQPSVDSALLLVSDISRDFFRHVSERTFFNVVRAGFSSKRKFLAHNLSKIAKNSHAAIARCGISRKARAEDLSLEEWGRLVRAIR